MTVIDATTFDAPAAERRAERIRLRLDAIADNYTAVLPMIREAIEKRDDVTLGYRSPGEYVADRFGGALTTLGIEVRREVVRELTEAGLSTRALAPVLGVGHKTVARDFIAAGVSGDTPQPGPARADIVTGLPTVAPAINPDTGEVADDYPEPPPAAPTPVTGLDGKTYTRPEPKPAPQGGPVPAATARPPAPPKFGTRRRHAPQIDALVIAISGGVAAFEHVLTETDLDHTVTAEEAARLMGDLSEQIRSLNRIRNLLKERTK